MLIPIFCDYLLSKNLITLSQQHEILEAKCTIRPLLTSVAVKQGFISQEDLARYNEITEPGGFFNDVAIQEGFITQNDLFELLKLQMREDFVLFEVLESTGIMTRDAAEKYLSDFIALYDLAPDDCIKLIDGDISVCLTKIAHMPEGSLFLKFADTFLNIILQTIDPDLIVREYYKTDEKIFRNMTALTFSSKDEEPHHILCGYSGEKDTLLAVAGSYAHTEEAGFTTVCRDSLKELLNCAGGTFTGLLEKDSLLDYNLSVPEFYLENHIQNPEVLEIMTTYGTMQVIFSYNGVVD